MRVCDIAIESVVLIRCVRRAIHQEYTMLVTIHSRLPMHAINVVAVELVGAALSRVYTKATNQFTFGPQEIRILVAVAIRILAPILPSLVILDVITSQRTT